MALTELWLAILLAGVGVFIVSSLIHMVIGWHNGDYGPLPDEDAVMDAMRAQNVSAGQYMTPGADCMKDMQNPEFLAKYERGPVAFISVLPPGPISMGKSLAIWFGYTILMSLFIAYILTLALKPGAEYMQVFRLACTVGLVGYSLPSILDSIWKGVRWATTGRFLVDGVLYALMTAGVFAWQWPTA